MKKMIVFILTAMLISSFGVTVAQTGDSWTILHYSNMDNDLEKYIFEDMMEIRSAGSSELVNFVAQIDRIDGYYDAHGDWTDTRRFYLSQRDIPTFTLEQQADALAQWGVERGMGDYEAIYQELINTPPQVVEQLFRQLSLHVVFDEQAAEVLGEVNMGDPQTLADFIAWGITNYPADHYMLIISSHGNGWAGIGPDETNDTILNLQAMHDGIRAGLDVVGVDKLDIIGFDACLMAQYEVGVALAPVADYLLAAEEVIPGRGWEYSVPYATLNANPTMDAVTLGKTIIDGYMDFYGGVGDTKQVDLHLIDLNKIDGVSQAITNFEGVAGVNMPILLTALGGAWNNTQKFGLNAVEPPNLRAYLDLIDFMTRLGLQTTIPADLLQASSNVVDAVNASIVYSRADDYLPGANGLSIYFPLNADLYAVYGVLRDTPYATMVPISTASWQTFFTAFHQTIATQLNPDLLGVDIATVIAYGENAVNTYDPPVIVMDIMGQGIATIAAYAVWQLPSGEQVIISYDTIARQIFLSVGDEAYELIEYAEGRFQYTWDVLAPALSDGNVTTPVLLQPRTNKTAIIQGVYRNFEGVESEAALVYDSERESIVTMVVLASGGAPYEARPQPGDTFTPVWTVLDANGNSSNTLADATLDLSNGFPKLAYLPAPDGNYTLGVRLEDFAGNVKFATYPLTVANTGLDHAWRGYKNAILGINFLFPFSWSEPEVVVGESGIPALAITSPDDDYYTIIIASYSAQTLDAVIDQSLSNLREGTVGLTLYDRTVLADLPYSPVAYEFEYTLDGTPIAGVRLFYDIPDNGGVYVVNMTVRAGDYATGVELIGKLAQSISFFSPISD